MWETHVETRKRDGERGHPTPARARARRRRCRFRTRKTRRHSMSRLVFVFFGRKGSLAREITSRKNEKMQHNNGSVVCLSALSEKKENEDAKPRAREDARPAEEGNANANAYLALFLTRREQTKERNHRVREASMMCASSLNHE